MCRITVVHQVGATQVMVIGNKGSYSCMAAAGSSGGSLKMAILGVAMSTVEDSRPETFCAVLSSSLIAWTMMCSWEP